MCSDVAGFAPNAGPSHGYETSTGPTRFTTGNVATDNNPISNSRTDITGPTRYATSTSKCQGHSSNERSTDATGMSTGFMPDSSAVTAHNFYDEGPKYITNENGDVLGIAPRTPGTSGAHNDYHGSKSSGTPKGGKKLYQAIVMHVYARTINMKYTVHYKCISCSASLAETCSKEHSGATVSSATTARLQCTDQMSVGGGKAGTK